MSSKAIVSEILGSLFSFLPQGEKACSAMHFYQMAGLAADPKQGTQLIRLTSKYFLCIL